MLKIDVLYDENMKCQDCGKLHKDINIVGVIRDNTSLSASLYLCNTCLEKLTGYKQEEKEQDIMTPLMKAVKSMPDCLMSMAEFYNCVEDTGIIPDDGYGRVYELQTGNEVEGNEFDLVYDIKEEEHWKYVVMWYNI